MTGDCRDLPRHNDQVIDERIRNVRIYPEKRGWIRPLFITFLIPVLVSTLAKTVFEADRPIDARAGVKIDIGIVLGQTSNIRPFPIGLVGEVEYTQHQLRFWAQADMRYEIDAAIAIRFV